MDDSDEVLDQFERDEDAMGDQPLDTLIMDARENILGAWRLNADIAEGRVDPGELGGVMGQVMASQRRTVVALERLLRRVLDLARGRTDRILMPLLPSQQGKG